MSQAIRVLIVDDSALMRQVIAGLIEQDPSIQVVGYASDGREAIALAQKLRPDIVTMDVRMPVMDGLETTEYLMAYCPTPILVLTASLARYDVDITFKMLDAGALEVLEKPNGHSPAELAQARQVLIQRIKVLARVKVVTHLRGRRRSTSSKLETITARISARTLSTSQASAAPTRFTMVEATTIANEGKTPKFPLIVIGASTGGPRIVNQILNNLPGDLPAAVLVVQHIAAGFSLGLAEWLGHTSPMPVRLGKEGHQIMPGEIIVAPDQTDILIDSHSVVHLSNNTASIHRPSIDISMQAAAAIFGEYAIGVLLTGMGRDGAQGMLAIKRQGGYTIAQDETTCTIFGMPRAAIQLDAASDVLAAPAIAHHLIARVGQLAQTLTLKRGEV